MKFKLSLHMGVDYADDKDDIIRGQFTGFRYWYTPRKRFYIAEGCSRWGAGAIWVGDRSITYIDGNNHIIKVKEAFEPRFFFTDRYMSQFIIRDLINECSCLPNKPSWKRIQPIVDRVARAYGNIRCRASIDWGKVTGEEEKTWWLCAAFPFTHTMVCIVDDQAMKRRTGKFGSKLRKVRVH